jgi:hypothetical protein
MDFPIRQASGFFSPGLARIFPDEIPGQGDLTWSWDRTAATMQFQLALNPPALQAGGQGRMWEAENLQTVLSLSGQWFPREKRWEITGTQQVKAGSLALAPWIFPFTRDPLQAEFRGRIEQSPGSAPGSRLEGSLNLSYAPIGKLQASGLISFLFPNWTYAGSLELNELPTETAYPLLVAGPLALEHPFLEKVFLQGSLRARLQVGQTDKENSLQGRISSPGLKITTREPSFYLEDLAFDLPFQFSSDPESPLPSESGFLRIGDLQGPGLSARGLTLPVRFESDRLEVPGDITLSLWGGEATLKDLRVDHLLTKPTLLTALFLKDAELDRLFLNKRVAAELNGAFDSVVVSAEKASFDGVLRAELFDGQVEGTHWAIRQPFSRDRRIQADLSFSHLNLEPITRLFSFGQVTGYIQGTVNDLSVYDNQLEGFDLSLQTEEVKGVPKKIALKAVENISLLGTGSGELDVLSRGINRWIREYEYGSIGISCRLRGDRLQLRGTIIEEGVEYLVRKSGWSGIDVINKNPDNEIEFSDILERIKRMGRNHQPGGAHENH